MVLWKVVRKWLNLRNRVDDFNSDYTSAGKSKDKKKWKDCSGTACCVPAVKMSIKDRKKRFKDATLTKRGFESVATTSANKLNLSMFIGTWNVGGISPDCGLDLRDWIQAPSHPPSDFYIIGFQEIVPLNAANILGVEDNNPAAKWLSLIRQALNTSRGGDQETCHGGKNGTDFCPKHVRKPSDRSRICSSEMLFLDEFNETIQQNSDSSRYAIQKGRTKYCLAVSKQMVGLFLSVWVRAELYQHISNLKVSCVGTGILGYMGNKGSVSISMTFHQTSFCFICSHLASGEKENDKVQRNHDALEILKRTSFSPSQKNLGKPSCPNHILDHDNIFWLGDLNYRLVSGHSDTSELLKKHDWNSLLEKDQLLVERRTGGVFEGWEEGKIHFAPTYKYLINSDLYVSQIPKHKQKTPSPAWCDRILWRGKGMKQITYERGESRFSDHRPVYAIFTSDFDSSNVSTT